MPIEKYDCSIHAEQDIVVERTRVHIHGHPGITEWTGTLGPLEESLEIGPTYRIKLEDGRDGLVVIQEQLKAWGGVAGHRYAFEGIGGLS